MIQAKNKIFIVVGHSGSGKTSTMRSVMGADREIVSVTTRSPREGEIDGIDYYFINDEQFDELDNNGLLVEKTNYNGIGYKYGATKEEFEEKLAEGHVFIIVDINGMMQIKEAFPDNTISLFFYTSYNHALSNMLARGDSKESIIKRLSTYVKEVGNVFDYSFDYIVKNIGKHEEAKEFVKFIIQQETT